MGKLAYYLLTNLTALSNETTGIVDSAIFMEMVLLEPSELSLSSDDGLFGCQCGGSSLTTLTHTCHFVNDQSFRQTDVCFTF